MKELLFALTIAKPFLKWAGGKGKLIPQITALLPKDFEKQPVTFVEPFVGGGAMFFYMLQRFHNIRKVVINDLNSNLTRAYTTIRNHPNDLIDRLAHLQEQYLPLDEAGRQSFFLRQREVFNQHPEDDIENSALLIFLNRTCFNGLYRENSRGAFNVPHGRYARPLICDSETIMADSEMLKKVIILNGDYTNTIDYLDSNTLFYLDPPYRPLNATSSFNSYTSEAFNDDEQRRLKAFCDEIDQRHGRFMLSNSDGKSATPSDDFFDRLYDGYTIHRVQAARAINSNAQKRGPISELLITNF